MQIHAARPSRGKLVELRAGAEVAAGRFYDAVSPAAAVMVGGCAGGWDSPAGNLYQRLCEELPGDGVTALRVRYRYSALLGECVRDVLAGLAFLDRRGMRAAALVGHAFGGAVVARAAAVAPEVCAVVMLATQSYGVGPVGRLGQRCAVLLLHGAADPVLPPRCSRLVHDELQGPRALVLLPGAGHGLEEAAAEVHRRVREFLLRQLGRPG